MNHPSTQSESPTDRTGENGVEAGLSAVAREAVPGASTADNVRRLTAGANQETWSFDAVTPTGSVPLILRRARGGTLERATGIGLETEARLIETVAATGAPVPRVLHVLTPADGLGKGYVMLRIAGETIPRKILKNAEFGEVRPKLAAQCGQVLAALHAVPAATATGLAAFTPAERLEWLHERYRATGQTSAVVSWAFAWARRNAPPPPAQAVLVHGDFRNGNLMIGPEGIRAVLDWENAHLGDPAEDLGWLCIPSWRFGNLDLPVGGFGTREDMLAAYAAAGGTVPSPERLRFWEAYGTLYWGTVCARSVEEFRGGSDPSLERAMIARRLSECEIDLLRLLAPRD